eukprot:scaffold45102_cov18-Tisochrysis_lutea.AAC.1
MEANSSKHVQGHTEHTEHTHAHSNAHIDKTIHTQTHTHLHGDASRTLDSSVQSLVTTGLWIADVIIKLLWNMQQFYMCPCDKPTASRCSWQGLWRQSKKAFRGLSWRQRRKKVHSVHIT